MYFVELKSKLEDETLMQQEIKLDLVVSVTPPPVLVLNLLKDIELVPSSKR